MKKKLLFFLIQMTVILGSANAYGSEAPAWFGAELNTNAGNQGTDSGKHRSTDEAHEGDGIEWTWRIGTSSIVVRNQRHGCQTDPSVKQKPVVRR